MTEHEAVIWIEEQQMKPRHTVSLKMKPDGAQLYLFTGGTYHRVATREPVDLRLIDLVTQMKAKLSEVAP